MVQKLHAYVPGEQPKIQGLIKLNTNENPYGPSPQVLSALRRAVNDKLRLYPSPTADSLRERLAQHHGCSAENIIVGNGSDELLALATRAFVQPLTCLTQYALLNATGKSPRPAKVPLELRRALESSRYTVQFLQPSYSLYPVLAAIQGGWPKPVALTRDFSLPSARDLRKQGWDFQAGLTFITTPNAPSGRAIPIADLDQLCQAHWGVIVLDEAYVDFASENALALALKYPHVLVARTFSKAYSLCALRVGYFVGHPELIGALHKIRDSYNVNRLGQVAAEATFDSLPYYQKNFARIIQSREHLTGKLLQAGFEVCPSQTNFVLVRPPKFPAEAWLHQLREHRILVRWFNDPQLSDFLRISIGSEAEIEALLRAVEKIRA